MREKLNDNPVAQVAMVGLLVAVAAFMFLKPGGGGASSEETAASGATVATVNGATATGATPGEAVEGAVESLAAGGATGATASVSALPTSVPAPPLPRAVSAAYAAGDTVVLLVVHDGGIDDKLVAGSAAGAAGLPGVALFTVPAKQIARYAAITLGAEVQEVPALVVLRPRRLSAGTPQASVSYGYQTPQSVVQAVRDASYKGPEATYHPE